MLLVLQGSVQLHDAVLNIGLFSWENVAGERFDNEIVAPHGVLADINLDDGALNHLKGSIRCP